MVYQTAAPDEVDSVIDDGQGGMWFLRDALDTVALGVTLLEPEEGESGL